MKHLLFETNHSGSNIYLIYIISFLSIIFGIYVIISKNPILSVLFLIGLFTVIAVYLIVIGLHFIGLSYLLVYIGAVSILFLFILMLINVRISELVTDNKNSIPLAILILLLFIFSINDVIPAGISINKIINNNTYLTNNDISLLSNNFYLINVATVKTETWDTMLYSVSHIASLGNILYTNLFILLILTSLILLLSMIGTIIITMNKSLPTIKRK